MKKSNGQRLREIRLELKISQATMARLLCVSTRTVERWEYGERNCPRSAVKLAEMVAEKAATVN